MYIDIHTHSENQNKSVTCIYNWLINSDKDKNVHNKLYSVGVHPWHLSVKTFKNQLLMLEKIARSPQCAAIGEIGLDRVCATDFDLQKDAFVKQLKLAEQLNKPVIIHNVKAADNLLHYRNQYRQTPWIIHGFSGNRQLANQFISKDCYLSFGEKLMNGHSKTCETFKQCNLSQVFMETDAANYAIESLYQVAAELKKISLEILKHQIMSNFEKIFEVALP